MRFAGSRARTFQSRRSAARLDALQRRAASSARATRLSGDSSSASAPSERYQALSTHFSTAGCEHVPRRTRWTKRSGGPRGVPKLGRRSTPSALGDRAARARPRRLPASNNVLLARIGGRSHGRAGPGHASASRVRPGDDSRLSIESPGPAPVSYVRCARATKARSAALKPGWSCALWPKPGSTRRSAERALSRTSQIVSNAG